MSYGQRAYAINDSERRVVKTLGHELVHVWLRQSQTYGQYDSRAIFYFEGRTIYSYGNHFAIAHILPDGVILVNGDTYSNTTSKHQGVVRRAIEGRRHFIVPFSALNAAFGAQRRMGREDLDCITLIDMEAEREIPYMATVPVKQTVTRTQEIGGRWYFNGECPDVLDCTEANNNSGNHYHRFSPPLQESYESLENTGEYVQEERFHHLMGASVFKAVIKGQRQFEYIDCGQPKEHEGHYSDCYREWDDPDEIKFFISGIDETGRNLWNSFFMTELVRPVTSVQDAYEALKPGPVLIAEGVDIPVVRQGDLFFIRCGETRNAELDAEERKRERRIKVLNTWIDKPELTSDFRWKLTHAKLDAAQHRKALLPINPGSDPRRARESHRATRLLRFPDGRMYVRGRMTHDPKEHRAVSLAPGWHAVHFNVQRGSWSTDGKVD